MKTYNRVIETSSNTPSGASPQSISLSGVSPTLTFPGAGTAAGRLFNDVHNNGDITLAHIWQTNNPGLWIKARVTFATGTPKTLSVAAANITDGSAGAGAFPTWTGSVTCSEEASAEDLTDLLNLSEGQIPGGRLTLISGQPMPKDFTQYILSIDTVNDQMTLQQLGGVMTGMPVFGVPLSASELWNIRYFARVVSGSTIQFHPTYNDAINNTNKLDLTVSSPNGSRLWFGTAAGSTVYYTPYKSDIITLWDGVQWRPVRFTEQSISLGAQPLAPFDVFGVLSSGALTLETAAWLNTAVTISSATPAVVSYTSHPFQDNDPVALYSTGTLPTGLSNTAVYYVKYVDANSFQLVAHIGTTPKATLSAGSGTHFVVSLSKRSSTYELTYQDGRLCKTGDKARLWLGSFFYGDVTCGGVGLSVIEDSPVARNLFNAYHREPAYLLRDYVDRTFTAHTYNTALWRVWNDDWAGSLTVFVGLPTTVNVSAHHDMYQSWTTTPGTCYGSVSFDIPDAATVDGVGFTSTYNNRGATTKSVTIPQGFHTLFPVEYGSPGTGTGNDSFFAAQISAKLDR